jgi:hypothetical protein
VDNRGAREMRGRPYPADLTSRLTSAHLVLTLFARCECLKRHGVGEREGELGADFSSIVLPRVPRTKESFQLENSAEALQLRQRATNLSNDSTRYQPLD